MKKPNGKATIIIRSPPPAVNIHELSDQELTELGIQTHKIFNIILNQQSRQHFIRWLMFKRLIDHEYFRRTGQNLLIHEQ